MTKEETKRRFQSWCQREIGNNCSKEDYAMFNNIMALLEQQPSDDCVSRQAVIKSIGNNINISFEGQRGLQKYEEDVKLILQCILDEQTKRVEALPPVTPTHGTCKNCRHVSLNDDNDRYCDLSGRYYEPNYYCGDFEKRGNENGR